MPAKSKKAATLTPLEANAVRPSRDLTAPEGFVWLRAEQIVPDPNNARKLFDEDALGELADSMALKGMLQKPAVRLLAAGDTVHQLVAGERRWRAWKLLIGRGTWAEDHVELCPVIEGDDAFAGEAGLIENLQRRDLKPLEEARGFRRLIDVHGHTTGTIAEKVGFTMRFVQQRLQLLELNPGDMQKLEEGKITIEEARKRLAGYPKVLELSPDERRIMVEVALHLCRSKAHYYWDEVPVDSTVLGDPLVASLKEQGLLRLSEGYNDFFTQIAFAYEFTSHQLRTLTGVEDVTREREPALTAARFQMLKDQGLEGLPELQDRFLTDWLNGPFTRTQEAKVKHAARIEAMAKHRVEEAERQRQREEQNSLRLASERAATSVARTLLVQDDAPLKVQEVAQGGGRPLPWRWVEPEEAGRRGELKDANGRSVEFEYSVPINVLGPVIMAAVNRAGGFEPMIIADEDLDRAAFEQAMAEEITQQLSEEVDPATAAAKATTLLDAYLARRGIEFGADCNRWTARAAEQLADDLLETEEEEAADEDDAPAITAQDLDGEDAPIPDHLMTLAGVPAAAREPLTEEA